MTRIHPAATDPATAFSRADGTTETHADDHGRVIRVWENVQAHGAVGNGVADDTAAINAAITAAGNGGTVFFPEGDYLITSTISPLSGQVWLGAGREGYQANTYGTRITYNGTGTAIDLTSRSYVRIQNMKLRCTSALVTNGLLFGDPSNQNSIENVSLVGPSASAGTAIAFSGQSSCSCHNSFYRVDVAQWLTGVSLSGFANANYFSSMWFGIVGTAISLARQGSDTLGGNDNEFNRIEIDGNTATGIVLADTAQRNLFNKVVMDGVTTTSASIASGCLRNVFVACVFAPGSPTDSANNYTTLIACTGAGTPAAQGIKVGDTTLWRDGSSTALWRVDDNMAIDGGAAGLRVGGYSGSNQSGTGIGVFGNSEFQNDVHIGRHQYFTEVANPAAPAANRAVLWVQDNGAGKTQLCVRFNTGAVQVLATEP